MKHSHVKFPPPPTLPALSAIALGILLAGAGGAHADDDSMVQSKPADPRWLERLDEIDRSLLDENLGYAPPELTSELRWWGSKPLTWEELRGKVVVIQSWTSANNAGRGAPDRAQRALAAAEQDAKDDLVLIMLHTPDGSDDAEPFLINRKLQMPVLIDPKGTFCDELGVYQRPVNIVIDRNGIVRYAGLNPAGLTEAAKQLLAEAHNPEIQPEPRPADPDAPEAASESTSIEFPTFNNRLSSARDLRGRQAPEMYVGRWLNDRPDPGSQLVLIDFWATWCGPCIAAIPHVNELARDFRNDLLCVGLSDEQPTTVLNFMRTTPMNYTVAVDPRGRMKSGFGVTAIPHIAVMSSDWVVRWQGHPSQLTRQVMDQLVAANRQLAAQAAPTGRYRWTGGR